MLEIFNPVAYKYNLMNDLMSLGMHRIWKNYLIESCDIKKNDMVLDLACGSGDVTEKLVEKISGYGHVLAIDINMLMLKINKHNLISKNKFYNIDYLNSSAEYLPIIDNVFNCAVISFGFRNFNNKYLSLKNIYRVLKKGGRLIILEFANINNILFSYCYDIYSFSIIPRMGNIVCANSSSYQYLIESIRIHTNKNDLIKIMLAIGFRKCFYIELTGGVVSIHISTKI